MHMEAVQRYTINMTKEEVQELYELLRATPQGYVKGPLAELYSLLNIWVD